MDWNRMRDQIGWALTGVESYEHREARLSEDTPERILQDLIAELRDLHPVKTDYCLPCTHWGAVNAWAPEHWTGSDNRCPSLLAIDRAEQRLKGMTDE